MNELNPLTARRIAAIKAAITGKALTYKEIAAATFTSEAYTLTLLTRLRRERHPIFVAEWRLFTNTYAAAYRWGEGSDAARPEPMTGTEGQRAYRARIRKDPLRNELFLAKQRAKDRARTAASRPRNWAAMLFVGVRVPTMTAEG